MWQTLEMFYLCSKWSSEDKKVWNRTFTVLFTCNKRKQEHDTSLNNQLWTLYLAYNSRRLTFKFWMNIYLASTHYLKKNEGIHKHSVSVRKLFTIIPTEVYCLRMTIEWRKIILLNINDITGGIGLLIKRQCLVSRHQMTKCFSEFWQLPPAPYE